MPNDLPRRVAVVHDWLLDFSGAERVLAEILRCVPHADLFAVVDRLADADRDRLGGKRAATTFLQRTPARLSNLKYFIPLMPLAIEQLDLDGYDLVISSSHTVAKGVIVPPDALHVSYVHSPMRYAWDQQAAYLRGERGALLGALMRWRLHRLRLWDHRSAAGVDCFVANSRFVARRILKAYRRDAQVIYPPVDLEFFTPAGAREDYYVTVSRLVGYKRVDVLVEAFARMPERRLVVIGDGPELRALRRAAPPNVRVAGELPPVEVREHLRRARAFLFAAVEDFGIAPVEAMACGTPVIAFRRGGAAETVAAPGPGEPCGAFFDEQSPSALAEAVRVFETKPAIDSAACRRRAEAFSAPRFREEFSGFVRAQYARWATRRDT